MKIQNYVIKTSEGYVQYAQILSVEGVVEIAKARYTSDLQEAKPYTEIDYHEDVLAWEEFFSKNDITDYEFLPIQFQLI